MIATSIFPGRYIQGPHALKRLGQEIARFGESAFLIVDPFIHDSVLPEFKDEIAKSVEIKIERFKGECSDEEVANLSDVAGKAGMKVIVGIGGGKSIDTAKAVGYSLKVPVVIVPTIASSDAPCSALSVIYTPDGAFKRYLVLPRNPDLVLMDTAVIAKAPVRFIVSGMGDALATWFEAESAQNKFAGNMTGDMGSMTGLKLAELCYHTLLEYGTEAKLAAAAHVSTPAFERIVEANTLLSGIGFESGGLGAAHAIHNGLTVLEPCHHYFHGEKVAIGVLSSLVLTDKPVAEIERVFGFCEAIGLPTTLADIGLKDVTDADLMKVSKAACAEGESIHNEPTPITPEMVLSAMKVADAIGRHRKCVIAASGEHHHHHHH